MSLKAAEEEQATCREHPKRVYHGAFLRLRELQTIRCSYEIYASQVYHTGLSYGIELLVCSVLTGDLTVSAVDEMLVSPHVKNPSSTHNFNFMSCPDPSTSIKNMQLYHVLRVTMHLHSIEIYL